jgi:hypothetical protein
MLKVGLYQVDERLPSVSADGIAVVSSTRLDTRPPTGRLKLAQLRLFALLSVEQPPELLRRPIRAAEQRLFSEQMTHLFSYAPIPSMARPDPPSPEFCGMTSDQRAVPDFQDAAFTSGHVPIVRPNKKGPRAPGARPHHIIFIV